MTPVILSLMAALSLSPARAGDVAPHPEWTSAQVRASRPAAPEQALVFDLRTETHGADGPVRVETATVTLTPSFTYVAAGRERILDDYALCRILTWSDGAPGFHNTSCYAQPAFASFELVNRARLHGILARAGPAAEAEVADLAPYWSEAELSFQTTTQAPLALTRTEGGREYRLGEDAVVQITGTAARLDGDERRRVARFLARHVHLHPQVRRDLVADGVLPARWEDETRFASKPGREVLTVSNLHRAELAFLFRPASSPSRLRRARRTRSWTGRCRGRWRRRKAVRPFPSRRSTRSSPPCARRRRISARWRWRCAFCS